jgi:hypothetical protein
MNYAIENNKGERLAYSDRLAPVAELAQRFADENNTPVYILAVRSKEVISMRTPQI